MCSDRPLYKFSILAVTVTAHRYITVNHCLSAITDKRPLITNSNLPLYNGLTDMAVYRPGHLTVDHNSCDVTAVKLTTTLSILPGSALLCAIVALLLTLPFLRAAVASGIPVRVHLDVALPHVLRPLFVLGLILVRTALPRSEQGSAEVVLVG